LTTHVIKSRVGKLKTRVGKLSRRIFSKNLYPPWPESVPAPLPQLGPGADPLDGGSGGRLSVVCTSVQ